MKTQHLTVIGDPLICCVNGCYEPAAVLLRQEDDEGDDRQMIFCETCWLAMRSAFAPMTARDEIAASREVAAILQGKRHE